MKTTVCPFLLFQGHADEAIHFYVSLFPGSEVLDITRYAAGDPGPEGTISKASFTIAGQKVMCTDSWIKHDFTFNPAVSFFVTCDSEDELRRLLAALSDHGKTLMPLDNYGFSRLFAWVSDRFGVSWQLNLE